MSSTPQQPIGGGSNLLGRSSKAGLKTRIRSAPKYHPAEHGYGWLPFWPRIT